MVGKFDCVLLVTLIAIYLLSVDNIVLKLNILSNSFIFRDDNTFSHMNVSKCKDVTTYT